MADRNPSPNTEAPLKTAPYSSDLGPNPLFKFRTGSKIQVQPPSPSQCQEFELLISPRCSRSAEERLQKNSFLRRKERKKRNQEIDEQTPRPPAENQSRLKTPHRPPAEPEPTQTSPPPGAPAAAPVAQTPEATTSGAPATEGARLQRPPRLQPLNPLRQRSRPTQPAATDAPKEAAPKEEPPKEETPKEQTPKEEPPKEETPKEETPKDPAPKEPAPEEPAPAEPPTQASAAPTETPSKPAEPTPAPEAKPAETPVATESAATAPAKEEEKPAQPDATPETKAPAESEAPK
ncbi:hypothetical protein CISG_04646 [Coccidioides immitis RMSCC 3703]|uniref:Uncharacterized protein n=1 Tax=Coccidioides immitis RMSCC 3703 TaxID=454286 RepID=A0A0J8TKV0_COCIT|nr:hypothetical protein CISG_04646 [Coccidioides immitis RMSCC 3703]